MKKKLINLIKVIAFALIAILLVGAVYGALRWKDTTGDYLSSFDQLYATDNDLIDVVFVGSSRCYDSAGPAFYWENAGISAFDMSVSGQDRDSSYHHLKELLKTQKPKVVFLELYGLYFEKNTMIGNIYRNLMSMKPSLNSVQLVRDQVSKYGDKSDIPEYIARFPIVHTRYRELKKNDFVTYEPNKFLRGEHVTWEKNTIDYYGAFDYPVEPGALQEDRIEWLDKMYELSQKEGFELILYVAPYQVSKNEQAMFDAAAEYADAHRIRMIDFNRCEDVSFDIAEDFFDSAHCNAYGAKKIAGYLTGLLVEDYDLEDHRGDARYYQWDRDLEYVYRQKDIYEAGASETCDAFMQKAASLDDVTFIISLEGEYGRYYNDEYYELFKGLGVSREDYEMGGKWLVRNGECIKVNDNDTAQEPFICELSKYDSLRVSYEGPFLCPENVQIGNELYSNEGFCLMIIMYDDMTDEVAAVGRF